MLQRMSLATTCHDYGAGGVLRRWLRLLVTGRPVAWLSAWLLPGIDRRIYRLSRGRVTFSAWITGLPIVELVTTGARSGELRSARVLGIPVGDGFLVVAANFGQASNPAWYHNLLAHPQVSVMAHGAAGDYYARELTGQDRERGFQLAVSLNPGWRRFEQRASPRPIPVMRLTPAAGSTGSATDLE